MPFALNDGCRLYWRSEGSPDRPALLLLNAIGTDMGVWDAVAPRLSARFRLIRADARGHGASDAPTGDYSLSLLASDARAVLDAAEIDCAAVCGLSLGGMVAMTLALEAPARVSRLVLACTSAQMDAAAWSARIQVVGEGGVGAIAEAALERFLSDRFRQAHPDQVASLRAGLMSMSDAGYLGAAAAMRDMDLQRRLTAISTPTLVIAGLHDVSTPFAGHGERIAAGIRGARAVVLDTAHLPCVEDPSGFSAVVLGWLDEGAGEVAAAADVLFDAGLLNRRRILGDAWVDRALAGRTPFTADFQAMITRTAWREVWGRPGLDDRTRRLLVVAITAGLGCWEEFRLHVRSGLQQDGFTEAELKETLMQVAIYAGVPAANTAFAEAGEIVASRRSGSATA